MTKSCVLGFALFVLMHTPARAGVIYNSFLPGDTYSGNRGDFGWRGVDRLLRRSGGIYGAVRLFPHHD
jgi:hypothetical protein